MARDPACCWDSPPSVKVEDTDMSLLREAGSTVEVEEARDDISWLELVVPDWDELLDRAGSRH